VFERGSSKPTHEMLESRKRQIELLLTQSPVLQRVLTSGSDEAKKLLADAPSLYAKVGSEANGGQVAITIKLLDEALNQIVATSRLVPDSEHLQERTRYSSHWLRLKHFKKYTKHLLPRGPITKKYWLQIIMIKRK
jgi:hypothetical protein